MNIVEDRWWGRPDGFATNAVCESTKLVGFFESLQKLFRRKVCPSVVLADSLSGRLLTDTYENWTGRPRHKSICIKQGKFVRGVVWS